jgi:hypothetical protein
MSVWSGELDTSFSTSDWDTASWVSESSEGENVGKAHFTNAETLYDFWNTGLGSVINNIEVSINGGTRVPVQYDTGNSITSNVSLDLANGQPSGVPETNPTTITSLVFYYQTQNKIEIDYDGGEILLDGQALSINLKTTDNLDLRSGQNLNLRSIGQYPVRIYTDNNTHMWEFDTTGSLTLPREGKIYGIGQGAASDRAGYISWAGNSSGDGSGYNTMRLVPDLQGLEDADQYIIIDPTGGEPGHIHIRAGGTQDNSGAHLYLGGEHSHVKISAGPNPPVTVLANNNAWTFGTDGTTQFPNSLILAPVSQSITMQSDQYSQLMWQNANVTVAPNMATYSNFYVAQNSATLDIGYLDGNSSPQFKEWLWSVDGNLTLPSGGYILNSDNSIYGAGSSYSNVDVASYLPTYSGNIGNIDLVANLGATSGSLATITSVLTSSNVAIGENAAYTAQGQYAVAIGLYAGGDTQGERAVAIGSNAGKTAQGAYAVAIGRRAGETNQGNNSIIINATTGVLNQTTANTFTVAPVRNDVANISQIMFYNTTSKEVTYGNIINIAGNVSANYFVGNGALLTGIVGGGSGYGNTEVATYLTNYDGDINFTSSVAIISNVDVITVLDHIRSPSYQYSNGVSILSGLGYGNTEVASYLPTYSGNIAATVEGYTIGYKEVPQVSAGNVTLALSDSGKHYYSLAAAPTTLTIPSNANVAFPIGTAISIVNAGTGNITIGKQAEASLYLAGNTTNATRTLTSYGMATVLKTATNQWFISGSGLE